MCFFKATVKILYWQTVVKNTYIVVLTFFENDQISTEHITIFLSKYIYKDAIYLKFSPDVDNYPSNPYILIKQNE